MNEGCTVAHSRSLRMQNSRVNLSWSTCTGLSHPAKWTCRRASKASARGFCKQKLNIRRSWFMRQFVHLTTAVCLKWLRRVPVATVWDQGMGPVFLSIVFTILRGLILQSRRDMKNTVTQSKFEVLQKCKHTLGHFNAMPHKFVIENKDMVATVFLIGVPMTLALTTDSSTFLEPVTAAS